MSPPPLPQIGLGLPDPLADNLRFRLEEAERCREACAWLAATIMYGSVLETVLLAVLGRDEPAALAAARAPRPKSGGKSFPLNTWGLEALLNVAVDLRKLDPAMAEYAHALRDARNLIHPAKQERERSSPDEWLVNVSRQVVESVMATLDIDRGP